MQVFHFSLPTADTCANGGGTQSFLNAIGNLTDPSNKVWFHEKSTNASGVIQGNAGNAGVVSITGPNAARSLTVYNHATGSKWHGQGNSSKAYAYTVSMFAYTSCRTV